jgi:predicted NAD-dependent protein-ADP-ribosyltransferase YbiA (DUF1768 family)
MEISSKAPYPAGALSNFAPHAFVFDGVPCASMEGLLQSFKHNKPHIQAEICKLAGMAAKRRGSQRNRQWRRVQKLWWNGVEYDRHGREYQVLLDRAFDALSVNEGFRNALLATRGAVLRHSMGKSNPSDTVLTEREFVSRLTRLRERLVAESRMANRSAR